MQARPPPRGRAPPRPAPPAAVAHAARTVTAPGRALRSCGAGRGAPSAPTSARVKTNLGGALPWARPGPARPRLTMRNQSHNAPGRVSTRQRLRPGAARHRQATPGVSGGKKQTKTERGGGHDDSYSVARREAKAAEGEPRTFGGDHRGLSKALPRQYCDRPRSAPRAASGSQPMAPPARQRATHWPC